MKNDNTDKDIMDYIDGISDQLNSDRARGEAKVLKQLVSDLKEIPLETINPQADNRFYQFINEKSTNQKSVIYLKRWLPLGLAAASIILLLFVFNYNNSYEDAYRALNSNPDRIRYIYNLNGTELTSTDIDWLQSELKNDVHPNIKVTIVDLLTHHKSKLNQEFYDNLQNESIPSVQMALLDIFESSTHVAISDALLIFSQKEDLDASVRQKANYILSNQ
ncbi:hypothetical protein [Winogradskyella sp.]|uniref:hypothetical protein n=1 Tax=Winogradskyella sp. TaxID=1883156 RepID=UPI00260DE3C9|nr:hypothetical protein [Winogradskyella sp.]